MSADALKTAIDLADTASYDYYTKEAWKRAGRAVLRKLAKDLGLVKGTYDIRFCEGGIAVSGDATLHSDRLYICLTGFGDGTAGYARIVKSRKDYTGERNIPIPPNYDSLLRIAQGLMSHGAATQVVA